MLLLCFQVNGQNLLAVLDVVSDGTVPAKNCTILSDTISAVLARDTTYMQFDRAMLPDLLGQLSVKDASTACSDPQCLALIGNMFGANYVIGGFVRYKDNLTEIELNLVDVGDKRALNTVSMKTGSRKKIIFSSEIPALVKDLLNPHATPPPTKLIAEKKSVLTNPLLYVGTLLAGGLGAGAYYYKYYYQPSHTPTPDKPDPVVPEPSLYGDFPEREE